MTANAVSSEYFLQKCMSFPHLKTSHTRQFAEFTKLFQQFFGVASPTFSQIIFHRYNMFQLHATHVLPPILKMVLLTKVRIRPHTISIPIQKPTRVHGTTWEQPILFFIHIFAGCCCAHIQQRSNSLKQVILPRQKNRVARAAITTLKKKEQNNYYSTVCKKTIR